MPDAALGEAIRAVLSESPFHAEGHRKLRAWVTQDRGVHDRRSAECVGIHAAARATRFQERKE